MKPQVSSEKIQELLQLLLHECVCAYSFLPNFNSFFKHGIKYLPNVQISIIISPYTHFE